MWSSAQIDKVTYSVYAGHLRHFRVDQFDLKLVGLKKIKSLFFCAIKPFERQLFLDNFLNVAVKILVVVLSDFCWCSKVVEKARVSSWSMCKQRIWVFKFDCIPKNVSTWMPKSVLIEFQGLNRATMLKTTIDIVYLCERTIPSCNIRAQKKLTNSWLKLTSSWFQVFLGLPFHQNTLGH